MESTSRCALRVLLSRLSSFYLLSHIASQTRRTKKSEEACLASPGESDRSYVTGLFRAKTWATVYDQVRRDNSGLFNALNLASLKVGRPSPREAPVECGHLGSGEEYLKAWIAWYNGIDESVLPAADLQKKAEKKGLSVPDAFAGLLAFDMLCLAAARYVFPERTFAKLADVTRALPYATLSLKHAAAAEY